MIITKLTDLQLLMTNRAYIKTNNLTGDIVSNNIGSVKIFDIPIGTFGLRDNLACAIQNSFRSKRKSLVLPLE